MPDETSKNSRRTQACDGCRSRKIKCDTDDFGAGKPCSKCVDAEMQCTFTYKRKKRKPKIAMYQSTEDFVSMAKTLMKQVLSFPESYIPPPDSASVRDIIISLAKYARSIEETLARSQTSTIGADSHPDSSRQESTSPISDINDLSGEYSSDERDDVNESFKQLSLGHSSSRYFGRSSNFRFIYNTITLSKLDKNPLDLTRLKRPEYWGLEIWCLQPLVFTAPAHYTFPASDLLWKLIHIYFDHTLIPILHRPTFERAVTKGLHVLDSNFGAIVLAVCSIGARNCDDPRVLFLDTNLTLGSQWFRQIRHVRSNFIEPSSVFELQLYCLIYIYLEQTNLWDASWPLIGLGLRLAVDRGIHRLKTGGARTVESELCIRAFWNLRSFDIIQGLTLGRPPATTSEEFDLDRPAEVDDDYWEKTEQHEEFTQPAGTVSFLSFFTHYHKLMDIAAAVQKIIYCLTERKRNQQKVMEQDSALHTWLTSVPNHLLWDPNQSNETYLIQSAMLYTTYYWIQVHLHRAYSIQHGSSPQQIFRSLAICALAARSTIRIVQVLCQRSPGHLTDVANALVQSTTVLLSILWKYKRGIDPGPSADIRTVASDLEIALDLLAVAETKSQRLGRIRDKWSAFILAEDLLSGIPTQPTPTSKRAREDDLDSHDEQNPEPNAMTFSVAEYRSPVTGFQPIDPGQAVHLGWNSPGANSITDTQAKFAQPEVNAFIPQNNATYRAFEAQPLYENDSIIDFINGQSEAAIQDGFCVGSDPIQDGSTLTQYDWDSFMQSVDETLLAVGLWG